MCLDGLRYYAFRLAKVRWGLGLAGSYLAVLAVPIGLMVGLPQWVGPCVAVTLAVLGKSLQFWSERARVDAEWLLRQDEFVKGLGWTIDLPRFAALQSKYSGYGVEARHNDSEEGTHYYAASGSPSPKLLVEMLRESAWWSQQLALKACKVATVVAVLTVVVSLFVVVIVARTDAPTVLLTVYAIVVCLIVALDTVFVAVRYGSASSGARESFNRLDALACGGEVDDGLMIATVAEYQMSRSHAPFVPTTFKRFHENALQEIWERTLERRS